jgi:hypothetical protein
MQASDESHCRGALNRRDVLLAGSALVAASALASAIPMDRARAQAAAMPSAIAEQEARAIGVDAYLYFYPLITMDLTRRQAGNRGRVNAFVHARAYPPGDFRAVVRVNFDTLYSSTWLDMTKEPMIVSAPDTDGRYYLLPMLDMWTDVFASPGWRTTGTQAGNFMVTPPGWTGTIPTGMTRISAPTPVVWIIGRTRTDGPADYEAVHKIQDGYKITPLSGWGKPAGPVDVHIDPTVDMKTPPKVQVDTMPASKFFACAAELLKVHPPHLTDQPMIAQLRKIGIEVGQSFDPEKAEPALRKALESAPAQAQQLMAGRLPTMARVVNQWSMSADPMGVYGNSYLKRAIVAQVGLGANVPEDAIYPLNLGDETGRPLDGANRYALHFDKDDLPPANAFWSITLYDPQGFPVPNSLDRFAVSSWMPFTYDADGSLDLYFQNESPGPDREANWLPAPKGAFNLTLRIYAPRSQALTGKWKPPPIRRVAS